MDIPRPKPWQAWPEDKARLVYKGNIYQVYEWEQNQFDGSKKTFEMVKRTDCVTVIPITEDGKIMLTEESQPGIQPFLSSPGGGIDKRETPLQAAQRELLEESGYRARDFQLWYANQFYPRLDRAYYTFVAKGLSKDHEVELEAGERIQLRFVAFDEFLKIAGQRNYRDIDVALEVFRSMNNPDEFKRMKQLFSV